MIADDIRKQAGNKYRSIDWWTNSLMNELRNQQKRDINEADTGFIKPGDLVFFLYSAKYPQRYEYWDKHPLSYVLDISFAEGWFL